MKLGLWTFALSSICAGIFDLIWREFEPAHQPVRALADPLPAEPVLAAIGAAILILGGAALFFRRTERPGAVALGAIYLLFAICWVPRFFSSARVMGLHFAVVIGVTAMLFVELVLVAGAWLAYAWRNETNRARALTGTRWIIGLGSLAFGLAHLTSTKFVAGMIPAWMPGGGVFWVILTGIAFLLAGAAILAGIQHLLAARMLALMLLIFSVVLLTPGIFAQPHSHIAWGSDACNMTDAAAVFLYSEALKFRRQRK
jgi:hypothetical protein